MHASPGVGVALSGVCGVVRPQNQCLCAHASVVCVRGVPVIGNNTSSLVGVAISASLLPPAVNCGMFWYAYLPAANRRGLRFVTRRLPPGPTRGLESR